MPTVLMTGGHGGIGFEAAKWLVTHYGYDVVLAGRSPERMTKSAEALKLLAGGNVRLLELDTSSLSSVRAATAELCTWLNTGVVDRLQAIVCNAGARFFDLSYSVDGYEQTFATNVLGHFLLVELLIGHMAPDGRVVFTVSGTHDPDTIDGKLVGKSVEPDATALAMTGKNGSKPLSSGKRYSTSKLCMVMHSYELARRLSNSGSAAVSIAYDPGSVTDSDFMRRVPAPVRWAVNSSLMKWVTKQVGITPGDLSFSGQSLAALAVDPIYQGSSGKYFQSNDLKLVEKRSATISYDEQRAGKLWHDSNQLVGLRPEEGSPLVR